MGVIGNLRFIADTGFDCGIIKFIINFRLQGKQLACQKKVFLKFMP
jgi:hypothetical protein